MSTETPMPAGLSGEKFGVAWSGIANAFRDAGGHFTPEQVLYVVRAFADNVEANLRLHREQIEREPAAALENEGGAS